MAIKHTADFTGILEALDKRDIKTLATETYDLLKRGAQPFLPVAKLGMLAIRADKTGMSTGSLVAFGNLAAYTKYSTAFTSPEDTSRRYASIIVPLIQGMLSVREEVKAGLNNEQGSYPEPLVPALVQEEGGLFALMCKAVETHDQDQANRVLMGLYRTGVDYREMLTTIYGSLRNSFPKDGLPLITTHTASGLLDAAEWGDRVPDVFMWLTQFITAKPANQEFLTGVDEFLNDSEHDLDFLRTRLEPAKNEYADSKLVHMILTSDFNSALDSVYRALLNGASAQAAAGAICVAAAENVIQVADGDEGGLLEAAATLQYANAARTAVTQIQDKKVLPLIFNATAAINSNSKDQPTFKSAVSTALAGGLIATSLLESVKQSIIDRDIETSTSSSKRYLQLGHPTRALAGVVAEALSSVVPTNDAKNSSLLQASVAACESYLALSPERQKEDGAVLIAAAVKLSSYLKSDTHITDEITAAVMQEAASV